MGVRNRDFVVPRFVTNAGDDFRTSIGDSLKTYEREERLPELSGIEGLPVVPENGLPKDSFQMGSTTTYHVRDEEVRVDWGYIGSVTPLGHQPESLFLRVVNGKVFEVRSTDLTYVTHTNENAAELKGEKINKVLTNLLI